MVSPARRRDAVRYLVRRFPVSERRACRLLGQHRSTQRYRPLHPEYELRLVKRMNELAARHPRYGYRRVLKDPWVSWRLRCRALSWRKEMLLRCRDRGSTPMSCASVRSVSTSSRIVRSRTSPRDLGIHKEALRQWVRQAEADRGVRRDLLKTDEREELKELRKENAELRRANAILKDASVYFAQELDPTRRR
jgi:transposase